MAAPLENLAIRAMRDEDLPAATALWNLPLVRWGTLATPYQSIAQARRQRETPEAALVKHIVASVEDKIVGTAALYRSRPGRREHVAGLGLCVHDDWQGRGVGTALMVALVDLAGWLNLRRLELHVYTDNPAALALYRKFGFEIEGTEQDDAFRDGVYASTHVMARLSGDLPRDTTPIAVPALRPRSPFTLRAAEPGDAAAVADIFNQPRVRHFTLRAPFGRPEDNAALLAPGDSAKAIAAVVENQVVGIATLRPGRLRRAHTGEITLLAVHDAWAGAGIGAALLAALLDVADNWLNLRRLTLGVLADNIVALALYKGSGFVQEVWQRADVWRIGGYADTLSIARRRPGP